MVGEGLRPLVAESTPPQLQSLLDACWEREPNARPTASEIVTALSRMKVRCTVLCSTPRPYACPIPERVALRPSHVFGVPGGIGLV